MPDSVLNLQSLPTEYQQVIQIAENRFGITVSPLQELAGGWSGAVIYLVRVSTVESEQVEHLILKLDRKHPKATSDELSRHRKVQELSPPDFTEAHIPGIAFERVEAGEAQAFFYSIAGQSLHNYRPLSNYRRQNRLERLFSATYLHILDGWNQKLEFKTIRHPQQLLADWLGFRLEPGQKIEAFLKEVCRLPSTIQGLIVEGKLLPNPLLYARDSVIWGKTRALDIAFGLQHGDLNTNNILARFKRHSDDLDGYYLIDFALFKEDSPLFYDLRYLEMSYLIHAISSGSLSNVVDLILRYSEYELLDSQQAPIEMAGVNAAILAGRKTFESWVHANHPSLHDDLWGQYWLAGTAAGLSYCHKAGLPDQIRLAGMIYAASNLKQFFSLFGIPVPAQAAQLYSEGLLGGAAGFEEILIQPALIETPKLPVPLTTFIGREAAIAELTALLTQPEVRLLTLTGPGGTGKTRLAVEVASSLLEQFPQGIYFVDLAGIQEPALVVSTTAHTLGIREGGGQPPLEKLKSYLAQLAVLLIFDNFEQVSEAATDVTELLSAAPGLKAVVTSRVPLHVRGEHEYPVPPLEIPPDSDQSLGETLAYDSIALFLQQSRAVQPRFEITDENLRAVVEICQHLDGLPLAIEIAAARTKLLPPEALLKRLDHSLQILVGGPQDLPDRQQTLRKTIDWSYQLLKPGERELFMRLGIFAGGFTLEAAAEICRPVDELEVFEGIDTLLDNNLLRKALSVTDELRFDILQTIREFALEKAGEAGILEELERTHCSYFTQLAGGGMEGGIYGPDSVYWLRRYEQEHDNFRQAMAWAINRPDEGVLPMIAMMTQLSWFWYRYGYLKEGSEWANRALAATEGMGESPARAFALAARGSLALWSGELPLAAQMTRQSMEMGQRLNIELVISLTKMTHGTTLVNQGLDREAYPHLVDAVELFDGQNQTWLKGTALVHLANVSLGLGDAEQALQWLEIATPLLNATGDIWNIAFGLSNRGEVARAQGDYEKAELYYLRTEALYKQADSKGDQARLQTVLGYIAQHKGEYQKAHSLFLESLVEFRKLGNQRGIAESLAGLAGLAAERGEAAWGAPLLSAAERLLHSLQGVWWPADRGEIERALERMRAELGDGMDAYWAQGQGMGAEESIAYATSGW